MTLSNLSSGGGALTLLRDGHADAYQLTNPSYIIGRQPGCDIVLDDYLVSRRHAKIERSDEHYLLADLGSSNGTYVNGERIFELYRLKHQDEIGLGGAAAQFRFVDQNATRRPLLDYLQREKRFVFDGKALDLPPNQFKLLYHLYRHAGQLCDHASCVKAIWNEDASRHPERIDQLHGEVSELRRRLAAINPHIKPIENRRGHGYSLNQRA